MAKKHRPTIRGGRKRTYKTNAEYRLHLRSQVQNGMGTTAEGSPRGEHGETTFNHLKAGSKL